MHPLLNPGLGLIFWTFLAFIVVLIILKKYAWKPILSTLKERETSIAESIASADKLKAEMAQMQSDNEVLLAKAREERALLIKEAKETKDRIINESKEQAKIEANKIIVEAQAAIQNQKMAALTEVKNQVGALVVEVATKVLQRELSDKSAQEQFISDLTSKVKLN